MPLLDEVAVEAEATENSLEEAIEQEARRSLLLLERDSIEQKRERVERMFDRVATLVAQLSPELCKEDHGKFMGLAAQIEQLSLCIQARLVSLEHDVSAQEIPDVPLVARLLWFADRARKLVHARSERIRKRDADVAIIRSWRELVRTERARPSSIHEEAVQHTKRLLLYDDARYKQLQEQIRRTAEDIREAERRGSYDKRDALKEANKALEATLPQLDKEMYDRALQKVQESDNGPRQK